MAEHTFTHPALDALEGRLTVTIEEAARVLGLGRSAAYEAARRGEIPSRRLGRRIVVPVPLLLQWLGLLAAV
jgi:excisionase family DNA binding protein